MASRTRRRVAGATGFGPPFTTYETVAVDTPASRATSSRVGRFIGPKVFPALASHRETVAGSFHHLRPPQRTRATALAGRPAWVRSAAAMLSSPRGRTSATATLRPAAAAFGGAPPRA